MAPGYVTIGTAGEMLMCNSTICFTDPEGRATRHAGRGGVGAVMGSKGIKAIVLDPAGTPVIRKPKKPEAFKAASRAFAQGLSSHPVCGTGLPTYGTNVLVNILNEAGGLPTKTFQLAVLKARIRFVPKRWWKSRSGVAAILLMAVIAAAL